MSCFTAPLQQNADNKHHVVIVGGGFGGLYAAKALSKADVKVTLIDKRNFHLFQPLLYQVATGGLSPADITSPLRAVLSRQKNAFVIHAEVSAFDTGARRVMLKDGGEVPYDTLIVATGAKHNYFGREEWQRNAPGMKTIENALDIRSRIFMAFEAAEREQDDHARRACMTFTVVGGGPTGVELAGALGELAHRTLRDDFRNIDPREARVILVEAGERILPSYPPDLSAKAQAALEKLGVTVRTNTLVQENTENQVTVRRGDSWDYIPSRTVLWGAGVRASRLGKLLAGACGAQLDPAGRVKVNPDLTVGTHPDVFVIGDLAHFAHTDDGKPLPGVAPAAMQQGLYVARLIRERLQGFTLAPFRYHNKGSMAVIGRNAAVAFAGRIKISGFPAWLAWVFVHIAYLIEYDNRLMVLFQWGWDYFTRKRGARLITGEHRIPLVRPGAVRRERARRPDRRLLALKK